jgi:single-strand DNA-binding protein
MNNCNFIGRLTKDPELKYVGGDNKSLCNFTLAVDKPVKDAQGNKQADFVPCTAWGKTAELLSQYFNKGSQIGITGRFESRSYEDESGNKKTSYSILVNNIDFVGGKSERKPQAPAPVAPQKKIEATPDNEDDYGLPFPVEGA